MTDLPEVAEAPPESRLPQRILVNFTGLESEDEQLPWHSPTDYALISVEPPALPDGIHAIEAENFEEIDLLDIVRVENRDPHLQFSDGGGVLQLWQQDQTPDPLLSWDLHHMEPAAEPMTTSQLMKAAMRQKRSAA